MMISWKKVFVVSFLISFIVMGLASCVNEDDAIDIDTQQQRILKEKDEILLLKSKIEEAQTRFESGEMTVSDAKEIMALTQKRISLSLDAIDDAKNAIEDIQEGGTKWYEIAGYILLSQLGIELPLRGIPSKGIGKLIAGLFRKKKGAGENSVPI